ncbi:hypothetical protein SAMN05216490_0963 [Mucilaginibacter mallensis]|uniref:Uncharacterized protein n=1 Tax=Mucilaginibacter mallensis TaxID=652787 RepID=A0A1H1RBT3_MUCMA|nr:hypothetical protein [Mucilaginibacter mallensis]SDS33182.1 hypothetical protein SAMN05216490_0963 [Mucilaginibacter mallensis]
MIKNILLIASCMLIISCASKQHKAEKLVKSYLATHLNDPASYDAVSFGDIDTVFKRYAETKQYDSIRSANIAAKQKVDKIRDTLMNLITTSKMAYMEALKRQMQYEADTGTLSKTIRSNELLFKGPIKGWSIAHSYHAKNAAGFIVLHNAQFRLDSDLTAVVSAQDGR